MMMATLLMRIKCILSAGHFDGHGGPPVQYKAHCLMQHVEGYSGSHWKPPSGNHLLQIAPAAAKATANKTMTKTCTLFAGHSNGCGNALVQYHAHRPIEEVQGITRSHWSPSLGK
jgi:hypothetical protein